MLIPQIGTFGDLSLIGADWVIGRGSRPSSFVLRVSYNRSLDLASSGTLTLQSNRSAWTLTGCIASVSTVRFEQGVTGKRHWVIRVWDRRRTWKGRRIDGGYNLRYRDCTVKPSTQKTMKELWDILFAKASEPSAVAYLSDATVHPPADWANELVTTAMDSLCELFPAHICLEASDRFTVRQTGDGPVIPTPESNLGKAPLYTCRVDRGPLKVCIRCAPTLFQAFLRLVAIGRDADGTIKPINDLSYKPAGGWEAEHPQFFSGVAPEYRHLAFKYIWRMYQVDVQDVPGCDVDIDDVQQFDLDDVLVEMGGTGDDKFQIPAFVRGRFYPYQDHWFDTGDCIAWGGDFTIDRDARAVVFAQPVWSAECSGSGGNGCTCEPELYLCTGFRVRDPDTWAFVRKEFCSDRSTGQGEQDLDHPELWETVVVSQTAACDTAAIPTKNTSVIQQEADVYLTAWKAHWDRLCRIRDCYFSGVFPLSLSGNIAQISGRLGRGLHPMTRASEHYEHHAFSR